MGEIASARLLPRIFVIELGKQGRRNLVGTMHPPRLPSQLPYHSYRVLVRYVAHSRSHSQIIISTQVDVAIDATMSQHVVCLRCARIKQACDGGSPCARCRRLDLHCEPKEHASQSTDSGLLTQKRAKITRTHTGCLTCKKRRRKCDETRPRCSDCRRLCLDCKYAKPAVHQSENLQPLKEPIDQDSLSMVITPILEVEAFEKNILDFDGDIVTEMFDSDDWEALMEHSPLISHQGAPSYTSNSGSPPISLPELSLVAISTAPDLSVDEDKSLLNHYMKVVASVLSRRDDRRTNPYLSKVLPIALQNQLVMNAVLALSASHWRKLQPSISRRGTIHQTNGKLQPSTMRSIH